MTLRMQSGDIVQGTVSWDDIGTSSLRVRCSDGDVTVLRPDRIESFTKSDAFRAT